MRTRFLVSTWVQRARKELERMSLPPLQLKKKQNNLQVNDFSWIHQS